MKRTYGLDEDHRPVKMGERVTDARSGRSGKIITLPIDKLEPVGDDDQAERPKPKPAPDPHLDHAGGKFAERLADDRAAFQPELFERG